MKTIAIIITIMCCCLMFVVKRETKAALLVMGAMTLTLVYVPVVPLHRANYLLPVAFLLSEWNHLEQHLRELLRTPHLWGPLLLVSVSALIAALTSPYVSVGSFFQSELVFKYFALAYAFWAVKDARSLKPVVRVSLWCLVALTAVGLLNELTRNATFVNELTVGQTSAIHEDLALGDVYAERSRFRVQSMFKSPFDYGYTCVLILLLHLYAWHRGLEKWGPALIALGCCLFGVIACECRVVWVCCILSVCSFYIWCFPLNRSILLGIVVVVALIFSYSTIEIVEQKVDRVTDIFKENPTVKGSSIGMRMGQLTMTIFYIQGHELLGRGHGYWAASRSQGRGGVQGLKGMESVVFYFLLERGVVGLLMWMAFYAWILCLFWQNRQREVFLTGLGASLLTAYILFAVGTGELGSVYPTMLLLGMTMKAIDGSQRWKRILVLLLRIMNSRKK